MACVIFITETTIITGSSYMDGTSLSNNQLQRILQHEMEQYAAHSLTATLYSIFDNEQQRYAIVSLPKLPRPFPSRVVLMARIENEIIIIEEDITDKPLVDALTMNSGIPREQIVLSYTGETLPE